MTSCLLTDKKRFLIVFAVLFGAALALAWRLACPPAVPAYNSHNLIRLHVIANSDSPVDQALKYQVRDAVVGAMAEKFSGVEDAEQARRIALENLDYIQELAAERIRAAGKDYPVTVEMGDFPFPEKTYHTSLCDFTLPAGNYEAVRVVLGRGAGANWWCVLFPPLCFVDPGSVVPAEKAAGACAGEAARVAGFKQGTGEKGERKRQNEREKQEQIQLARPLRESGAALNGIKGSQCDGEVFSSGNASSAAAPAFKLTAPEALVALSSLQKSENAWTLAAGGDRVEFRFKLLDFLHQSESWFKHLLGGEKECSRAS